MPVRATINGEVWEFDTPTEAAEFKRSMSVPTATPSISPAPQKKRGRPVKAQGQRGHATVMKRGAGGKLEDSRHVATLTPGSRQTLEAIRHAPREGLPSEEFAKVLGLSSVLAIPVRMMVLRKELKTMGLDADEVVRREHFYVKGRARSRFKAGPRIDDVLRQNGELFTNR